MDRILIASNNPGKIKEFKALLHDLDVDVASPGMLNLDLQVEENGATYADNANQKARAFAQKTGLLTLADDTGLEVDALGGIPGLHSARFVSKANATDADRRHYLLELLRDKNHPWTARFRCVLVLSTPDLKTNLTEGICEGEIVSEMRGIHGFGYDPLFLIPNLGKTMAELTLEEKNCISHRAHATQLMIPILLEILASSS